MEMQGEGTQQMAMQNAIDDDSVTGWYLAAALVRVDAGSSKL